MKASLKWLSKYVDISGLTAEELAAKLTFAGAEVEGIDRLASGTNLVIGEIISCASHPDSDHLHILQVDEGKEFGIHQIVCGAPNARKGLKVIVARTGAKLPEIEIKPSVIRGVESDGMCCSLLELGVDKKYLSDYQCAGIEELPADAIVGETNVLGYLGLDDVILDISVLPNRPDLYALSNIAREVACLLDRPCNLPEVKKLSLSKSDFKVGSATDKCPLFSARVVNGVKSASSPAWLSQALNSEGIRSIDAIVDIGNYVMLLTGQPLNMYDVDKLPAKELIVRDDYEGDFVAMDGNTYKLEKGDLVVTSGGRVMCLAGIMTADECKVDENTKNIAIEAAYFNGASIRRTSNRIGLASDSSLRFCKGINPDQAEYVQDVTSELVSELCGGSFEETVIYDEFPHSKKVIDTSFAYINGRLGTNFTGEEILSCLKRDNLSAISMGQKLIVTVPSYRIDMDGQADIAEEVIRILGYDKIVSTLPTTKLTCNGLNEKQSKERAIRHFLLSNGVNQCLTYTLVAKEEVSKFAYINDKEGYILKNPLTVDREAVRTNILHSLLKTAAYNVAHQEKDVALFEISDVDAPNEKGKRLSVVLSGNKAAWGKLDNPAYDFYDMKGLFEGIMDILGLNKNRYQLAAFDLGKEEWHPGCSAKITMGKKLLGVMGVIHPLAAKEYGLKNAVAMELDLAALLEMKTSKVKAVIPNKFPSVSRDLAFLINQDVAFEKVEKEIKKTDSLIEKVEVFDIYRGDNLPVGKVSMAISITISSMEKTLKEEEVAAVMKKAILTLNTVFGAEIRG